ncbi:MAG: RIO1 family regulatory kinase/ATPase [Nanoarchaeota archaeon]
MTTLTHQERFKTLKGVFDEFTNRNLFELQSHGIVDELVSPVKVGKESNVFLGIQGDKKVIVKIYRIQNCDFKRMYSYIGQDPRYEYLKKKRRDIILAWVQREYKNLLRAEEAQVAVPQALGRNQNIIVETLIGKELPAPALKDTYPAKPAQFLNLVLAEMRKLYQAGLIHGDLSAFNILNWQERPYLIDFSQATLVKTPNAEQLLERDIRNVLQFFRKVGVVEVNADVEKIKQKIKNE